MTPAETAALLRQFNNWCRDPSDFPASPMLIEKAIDAAIEMIDRLEAAEKDNALKEKLIDRLALELNSASLKRDELRDEIEKMKQQEPVAWLHESRRDSDVVTNAVKHVWGKAVAGALAAYSIPLYLAPGAQLAPSESSITAGILSGMFLSLDGHDKAQPGYEWRKGWNDAIRQAMDYAQPAPSVPEGYKLVPTAESRHPGIYKMLSALHVVDNTPGASEWESYAAFLAAAPEAKP